MERKREGNYDLLRIVSALAVIAIHVSSFYLKASRDEDVFGGLYTDHLLTVCCYQAMCKFAVPCFVMLSGAFLLSDERNADFGYFYKKSFRRIGVPTLIFSFLYYIYASRHILKVVFIKGKAFKRLLGPFMDLLEGRPYYHMWYMSMLVGLYLLVPVIIRVKRDVSARALSRLTWIFLVAAVISFETGSRSLSWDIGLSFYYVGYLLAGYEIKRRIGGRTHTGGGILLILAGLGVEAIAAFMRYRQALAGISDTELEYQYLKPLSPLIVAGSLLIFTGFSLIHVKRDLSKLASYTFLIYLIHAFVWNNLARKVIARRIGLEGDSRILIPACVILVFLISLLLAVLYTKLWDFFAGRLSSAAKNRKLFHKKFSAKKI